MAAIAKLKTDDPSPVIARYAYRSFDRQWAIADTRVGDFVREVLWRTHSDYQIYLTSLLTNVLGNGPALVACASVPDLDHFRGSFGGKHVIPLWRNREATEANILPGLRELLTAAFGTHVPPEGLLAYCYAVMAHPGYTRRFAAELEHRQPHLPLTKNGALFAEAVAIGKRLVWLHTYGQRFVRSGKPPGDIPKGKAQWRKPVSTKRDRYPERYDYDPARRLLAVGDGEVAPVEPSVWDFQVSDFRVVGSWLDYRMRRPGGKHSSRLDEIRPESWPAAYNTELLQLVWILEATVAEYPEQAALLDKIVAGPMFVASGLPSVPSSLRKAPAPEAEEHDPQSDLYA